MGAPNPGLNQKHSPRAIARLPDGSRQWGNFGGRFIIKKDNNYLTNCPLFFRSFTSEKLMNRIREGGC